MMAIEAVALRRGKAEEKYMTLLFARLSTGQDLVNGSL